MKKASVLSPQYNQLKKTELPGYDKGKDKTRRNDILSVKSSPSTPLSFYERMQLYVLKMNLITTCSFAVEIKWKRKYLSAYVL